MTYTPKNDSSYKKYLIGGLIILIIVVCAIVGYIHYDKTENNNMASDRTALDTVIGNVDTTVISKNLDEESLIKQRLENIFADALSNIDNRDYCTISILDKKFLTPEFYKARNLYYQALNIELNSICPPTEYIDLWTYSEEVTTFGEIKTKKIVVKNIKINSQMNAQAQVEFYREYIEGDDVINKDTKIKILELKKIENNWFIDDIIEEDGESEKITDNNLYKKLMQEK